MTADTLMLLGSFWLVHILAVVSPGPSFVVVSRTAVSRSALHGVAVAAGLAVGTFIWAVSAWFGLSLLFSVVPALYTVAKIAGAAFLLCIAFRMWRHADEPLQMERSTLNTTGSANAFRSGVLTQLANPKVAVFFGSVFSAVLPPDPSAAVITVIFLMVSANELVWFSLVASALSRVAVRRRYVVMKPAIDRLTGALLAGLGTKLLLTN